VTSEERPVTGKPRRQARLILVLGGAASGKSQVALELAGRRGPRAFLATGQALDLEMKVRIKRHQATRSSDWETAEVPTDLAKWFINTGVNYQSIVLDCLTLWLSNIKGRRLHDRDVCVATADLVCAMRTSKARVVIVSNELGMGLVPATKPVRAFRDLAGKVNQQMAAAADEVYMAIAGLPMRLK